MLRAKLTFLLTEDLKKVEFFNFLDTWGLRLLNEASFVQKIPKKKFKKFLKNSTETNSGDLKFRPIPAIEGRMECKSRYKKTIKKNSESDTTRTLKN